MVSTTCPAGKIVNPATGRCVNAKGVVGKAILASASLCKYTPSSKKSIVSTNSKKAIKSPSSKKSPASKKSTLSKKAIKSPASKKSRSIKKTTVSKSPVSASENSIASRSPFQSAIQSIKNAMSPQAKAATPRMYDLLKAKYTLKKGPRFANKNRNLRRKSRKSKNELKN